MTVVADGASATIYVDGTAIVTGVGVAVGSSVGAEPSSTTKDSFARLATLNM